MTGRPTGQRPLRVLGAGMAIVIFSLTALVVDSLRGDDAVGVETTGAPALLEDRGIGDRAALATAGTTLVPTPDVDTDAAVSDEEGQVQGEEEAAPPPSGEEFEAIRNRQEKFSRFADVPSHQLSVAALTEPAPRADNGASPEGQFRVACEYSHFNYDDPIVFPGQPGQSHLHMFFGNTRADAHTTQETLVNTGGGTCSGYELNRSAYWTPALLDGKGNVVVPDSIIIYYKTKHTDQVSALPQGLQMIAGNTSAETFQTSGDLHWSCGGSGQAYNKANRIPDCNGDIINASIVFPNCWDGVNLASDDFRSHLTSVKDNQSCPASHPVRLPKISILLYWPGTDSVDGWYLSSDRTGGFNGTPGGSLHADWWGGWNDEAMDLWIDGCMKASRNCSFGQTGTSRQLASLNAVEKYEGENVLPLPD